jgi:hypothetical protein
MRDCQKDGLSIKLTAGTGVGLLLILAMAFAPASAYARISPGEGIGPVHLGERMARVRATLGKPDRVHAPRWIYRAPLKGAIAFSHGRRAVSISTSSRRQRTNQGIGPGSTFKATKNAYPKAKCHRSPVKKRAFCTLVSRRHHRTFKTDFSFRSRLRSVVVYIVPPQAGTQVPK